MRSYKVWLMVMAAGALLSGCAQPKTAKIAPTATPALLVQIAPTGQRVQSQALDAGDVYVNDRLGFSLQFPADWKSNMYVVSDLDDGIRVYESKNHATSYEGLLFSVVVIDQDDVDEAAFADFTVLATKDGKALLGIRPTDVQFDYGDTELTKSYATLSVEVEGILKTAAFQ
ncbi:MAG: hypothetical protein PHO66_00700 [Eubacteriales bacterium]|nr:hypothetical protein [Eubacteriales bacterium]